MVACFGKPNLGGALFDGVAEPNTLVKLWATEGPDHCEDKNTLVNKLHGFFVGAEPSCELGLSVVLKLFEELGVLLLSADFFVQVVNYVS